MEEVGFPGVRGHSRIRSQLAHVMERGQLHHALIFAGPQGVGKATTARGLACALHCSTDPGRGCGQCTPCRRVLAGTHAGLEWIVPDTASGSISVDAIRELRARLEHAPLEGSAHVVVVDPGEALAPRSANALLKTLEEPRPGVHFVLVVSSLQALLPTILSRCLIIRFGRLDDDTVGAILEREDLEADPERVLTSIRLAGGSPGVARALARQQRLGATLTLVQRAIESQQSGPAGIFGGEQSPLWQAFRAASDGPKGQRAALERAAVTQLIDLWSLHLREQLRNRPGLPNLPEAPTDQDPSELVRAMEVLHELHRSITRNANARLALEHALLQLT